MPQSSTPLDSSSKPLPQTGSSSITTWDLLLACLSLYIVGALVADLLFDFPPEIATVLHMADTGICLMFMIDFFRRLIRAPSKAAYLKWGWIDFLASIPSLDSLRWGRMIGVTRLFMILRTVRSGRLLWRVVRGDPGRSVIAITVLLTIFVMIGSSILILLVETAEKSNIKNGYDALWWSLTTVTTVGYGDHFPVTPQGRMVAGLLMGVGIALYATFTAFISAKIMQFAQKEEKEEVEIILEEVKSLRAELKELRDCLASGRSGNGASAVDGDLDRAGIKV